MAKSVKAYFKQLLHEITHKPGFKQRGIAVLGNVCSGGEEKNRQALARMQQEEERKHTGIQVVEKPNPKRSRLLNPFHWPAVIIGAIRTFLCGIVDAFDCPTSVTFPKYQSSSVIAAVLKFLISVAIGAVEIPTFLICSKGFGRLVDAVIDHCAGNNDLVVTRYQGTVLSTDRQKPKLLRSHSTPHLGARNQTQVNLHELLGEVKKSVAQEDPTIIPGVVSSEHDATEPKTKQDARAPSVHHLRNRSKTVTDLNKEGVNFAELIRKLSKNSNPERRESKHSRVASSSSADSMIDHRIQEAEANAQQVKAQSKFKLEPSKQSHASLDSRGTPKAKATAKYTVPRKKHSLAIVSEVPTNGEETHAMRAFDFSVKQHTRGSS